MGPRRTAATDRAVASLEDSVGESGSDLKPIVSLPLLEPSQRRQLWRFFRRTAPCPGYPSNRLGVSSLIGDMTLDGGRRALRQVAGGGPIGGLTDDGHVRLRVKNDPERPC